MKPLELIANFPMFKYFAEQEIKQFIKLKISYQKFQKGNVVIRQGDVDTSLYLLIVGTVSILKHDSNIPIATLKPGDVFGEMSFLTKKPRHTDVFADKDVLVIRMDEDFFEKIDLVMKDKIKNYLIELLISRLDQMNEAISHIEAFAHIHKLPE